MRRLFSEMAEKCRENGHCVFLMGERERVAMRCFTSTYEQRIYSIITRPTILLTITERLWVILLQLPAKLLHQGREEILESLGVDEPLAALLRTNTRETGHSEGEQFERTHTSQSFLPGNE